MKSCIFFIVIITLSSCSCIKEAMEVKQVIPKGHNFYYYSDLKKLDSIRVYESTKKVEISKLKETNGMVTFKVNNLSESKLHTSYPVILENNEFDVNSYFFSPGTGFTHGDLKLDFTPYSHNFKYNERKFVLQSLIVPLKIRPRLDPVVYKDTFPSTTETGVTISIAAGAKWVYSKYIPEKNYQDLYFNRSTISSGILLGFSGVDLNSNTTRDPKIKFPRKATAISPGLYCVYGFNTIFLGLSFGLDFATGPGSDEWIYQGKPWAGIVLGFDIIK